MLGRMWFVLQYDYVDDYMERRGALRPAHFEVATGFFERGELVLAGAYADPADGATLIFQAADRSVVEAFVAADPYVANGLVTSWRIREWTVVLGGDVEPPSF